MNKIDEVLELLKQRERESEKPKNVILWVLAIVGAVAAVAGIAYAVYRFVTPDYLEDFEDDFDDFFDDDEYDDEYEEKPKKSIYRREKTHDESDEDDYELPAKSQQRPARSNNKVTPMRQPSRRSSVNMEVCVIKPASMEDTREIADTLLDNATVILNLEGIDVELAQRIIDFASGACYSLNGSLQKISSYIFVLGPSSVDITGDLQNILGGATPSVRAGY